MRATIGALGALLMALALAVPAPAEGPQEPAIQARVEFATPSEYEAFVALPGLDIMSAKPGVGVTIVTDAAQLEDLRGMGYDVTVEIPDMQAFYASRIRGANFGDFHTYSETEDFLDQLHATYPSITTAKFSIGTTEEGRDIWAIKISDNPEVDESEPEIVFDGLHHAREPISIEVQLNYMQWLCENYGTDPGATYLVDNREIFFVPIINPDGYCYNEMTNPSGGGMWRKNRRDVEGSSCYGVDPNRNYDIHWGEVGSASNPCDETYCGTGPESEPEIQAYTSFMNAHDFLFNLSFHSVAGCVLVPWGYSSTLHTPDDALLRDIGSVMARDNGYPVGQAGEMIGYSCSGTTTDWFYATRDRLAICIEVSGSGFWPLESEIPGLCETNLWPQIYATRLVGPYLAVDDTSFAGGDGDQDPEAGETLDLTVTVTNQGAYDDVTNATVSLATSDAYVSMIDAHSALGTIASRASASNTGDPLSFSIDGSVPDGHTLRLTLILDGDGFHSEEELSWLVGEPVVLFYDDMESGAGNWVESDGYWGLTTLNSHSGSYSYTDSPSGNYGNSRNTWIELASPIDLAGSGQAVLSFWQRVMTEEDYDYCYVEVSGDGGSTWHQLGPRYDGNINWEYIELAVPGEYCTSDFKVRFRFQSDTYVVSDGWYVDDVTVAGPPPGNTPPSAPTLVDPPDGAVLGTPTPTLTVANAADADGDELTYSFVIYGDDDRTEVVDSASGVTPILPAAPSWTPSSLEPGVYWWTAYADDGTERGPLMKTASFTIDASGVEDGSVGLSLGPARPNPFAARTELSFELPTRGDVSFSVYSLDGRLVRTLVSGPAGPGAVSITWDGTDNTGKRVASGLYFMRLSASGSTRLGKIMLLK